MNPLASPREYPARPSTFTDESVQSYLTAYEEAFVENHLTTHVEEAPEGTYPVDPEVDATVAAFRTGDGWWLAGVTCFGGMGYGLSDRTATAPGTSGTQTHTRTALPGITVHRAASYLLTARFLLREDHGWDRDAPAAVTGGTVYECFD